MIASLQQRILEQQDCGSEGLERKIKSKKKELEVKKEELLGLLREVKASKRKGKTTRSNVSTSTSEEENQEWELIEDLEEKVESLKEEKETLEESLKTLEKDLKDIKKDRFSSIFFDFPEKLLFIALQVASFKTGCAAKDQKAICKDLKPCRLVLEFTVDSCRTAFLEYLAEKARYGSGAVPAVNADQFNDSLVMLPCELCEDKLCWHSLKFVGGWRYKRLSITICCLAFPLRCLFSTHPHNLNDNRRYLRR